LSLLDQAISHGGGGVSADQMRDMLGLASRTRIIDLFDHVMSGRVKEALAEIKEQFDVGADPFVILSDLAEFTHLVTTAKLADGVPRGQALSDLEKAKAEEFAENLSIRVLSRAWQMLLKGIEEVQTARKPLAAADMVIVRLAYVADLPTPDEAIKLIKEGAGSGQGAPASNAAPQPSGNGGAPVAQYGGGQMSQPMPSGEPVMMNAPQNAPQTAPEMERPRPVLATNNPNPQPVEATPVPEAKAAESVRINRFEDLVAIAEEKRDLAFRHALEACVCLIAFENGRIEFSPTQQAPRNLASDIKARLKDWSGHDWQVIVAREGGDAPLKIQRAEEDAERTREAEEDPTVAAVLKQFPGSKIVNISFQEDEDILEAVPEDDDIDNDGETP
ncbi:MAG: DNA polymerase III subunit gamma/tau, partial [Hyphomicrobiales bacterium]